MVIPKPIVVVVTAGLIALAAWLLIGYFIDFSPGIEFRNTSALRLCYARSTPCSAEINPHTSSYWVPDSCDPCTVEIYTEDGRRVYAKRAPFKEWADAYVLINERDGEIIVTDSIQSN